MNLVTTEILLLKRIFEWKMCVFATVVFEESDSILDDSAKELTQLDDSAKELTQDPVREFKTIFEDPADILRLNS